MSEKAHYYPKKELNLKSVVDGARMWGVALDDVFVIDMAGHVIGRATAAYGYGREKAGGIRFDAGYRCGLSQPRIPAGIVRDKRRRPAGIAA